ncbi:class I SAM-dependent methyltransferase [Microbacterium sp. 179-I 3D2 NHS]|uniref:class I SAM-dependent methyltransferase n=1 Tax=Microbacterium sp. 179-I 3D2 NHS TaxID=3235178 RepID=UPI0039A051E6
MRFRRTDAGAASFPGVRSLAWRTGSSGADAADAVIADAYDVRAQQYVGLAGAVDQMDPRDRDAIARWRDATPGRLLDAGCGPGHWTRFLADGGDGRQVSGLDVSATFVAWARSRFPDLRFDIASFRALAQETASVGGILAWYSLIHTAPPDLPDVLAEFARVVAPGGSILIGYFEGEARAPFTHAVVDAYYWSADALAELLSDAGFTVVSRERRERVVGEISSRPHGAVVALRVG